MKLSRGEEIAQVTFGKKNVCEYTYVNVRFPNIVTYSNES